MPLETPSVRVRSADLTGPDGASVSRLVEAYLIQTELEKATRTGETGTIARLPERYRREVEDPACAYEGATVYLAELGDAPIGVVVVQRSPTTCEIKRVWVDPSARGLRVGSALMDAALEGGELPVRLTVWEWREDAIRLYRRRGFVPVPSWEQRPGLVCMELARQG
ncbi:GNAT family N-acetyltransferase [Microbacterium sp. SORGH_AS_0888]|uniref:GNAT family N-acetyltransferase n=1 Tax=Microbacterium sp. SORGH_AS_0888 TaxID=3041791 RepID=UPI002781A783|nr:GNAT family N-acetyltransferase [Microbacterium sp. SORGH_AS_0888]MDQ1130993.1 GNAT superfamily N-acetyltransferase [Microbacterium sp. SORGH_AS_0888]